ncbi:hypothetical protein HN670_01565, partial [bacterium]|nr:hypothetical protein [bacterium]
MSEIDFENNNQFSTEDSKKQEKKSWLKNLARIYTLFFLLFIGFVAGLVTSSISQNKSSENVIEATAEEIVSIFSNLEDVDPAL